MNDWDEKASRSLAERKTDCIPPRPFVHPKLPLASDALLVAVAIVFFSWAFVAGLRPYQLYAFTVFGLVLVFSKKTKQTLTPVLDIRCWVHGLILPGLIIIPAGYFLSSPSSGNEPRQVLIIIIALATAEELAFRMGLLRVLANRLMPLSWAALSSSFVFGLCHYRAEAPIPGVLLGLGAGLVLSYSYLRGKSPVFPILLHLSNNLVMHALA